MVHYMFETEWALTAPIDEVFDLIFRPDRYSTWWPQVKESRLTDEGSEDGVGRTASYTIRAPWGYSMRFELQALEVDRPHRVHALIRGDLVGTGTHYLETRPEGTRVRLHWYVSTTKRWMNAVAPLARPAFAFSHRFVMYRGCEGMARALGARLLDAESRMVDSPTPIPVSRQ